MALRLGDEAPDFTAETTEGTVNFHEWLGDSWGVLFSHPKDFTPVCTTELGYMASLKPEFDKRNVKIIELSVDSVEDHKRWAADIAEATGHAPNYPMIGDTDLKVSKLYDMLPAEAGETCEGRTAMDNMTVRNVFVVGPDKKIKLIIVYPMSTGRNFDEVIRVIDSMQLTAKHRSQHPSIGRTAKIASSCPQFLTKTRKQNSPPVGQPSNHIFASRRSRINRNADTLVRTPIYETSS